MVSKRRVSISLSAYKYIVEQKKRIVSLKRKNPKIFKKKNIDFAYTLDKLLEGKKYGRR